MDIYTKFYEFMALEFNSVTILIVNFIEWSCGRALF